MKKRLSQLSVVAALTVAGIGSIYFTYHGDAVPGVTVDELGVPLVEPGEVTRPERLAQALADYREWCNMMTDDELDRRLVEPFRPAPDVELWTLREMYAYGSAFTFGEYEGDIDYRDLLTHDDSSGRVDDAPRIVMATLIGRPGGAGSGGRAARDRRERRRLLDLIAIFTDTECGAMMKRQVTFDFCRSRRDTNVWKLRIEERDEDGDLTYATSGNVRFLRRRNRVKVWRSEYRPEAIPSLPTAFWLGQRRGLNLGDDTVYPVGAVSQLRCEYGGWCEIATKQPAPPDP